MTNQERYRPGSGCAAFVAGLWPGSNKQQTGGVLGLVLARLSTRADWSSIKKKSAAVDVCVISHGQDCMTVMCCHCYVCLTPVQLVCTIDASCAQLLHSLHCFLRSVKFCSTIAGCECGRSAHSAVTNRVKEGVELNKGRMGMSLVAHAGIIQVVYSQLTIRACELQRQLWQQICRRHHRGSAPITQHASYPGVGSAVISEGVVAGKLESNQSCCSPTCSIRSLPLLICCCL